MKCAWFCFFDFFLFFLLVDRRIQSKEKGIEEDLAHRDGGTSSSLALIPSLSRFSTVLVIPLSSSDQVRVSFLCVCLGFFFQ